MFMAKVGNNTSQSQFWMWLQLCFTCIFIKKGYHIRKYKRYLGDPSLPVPKSKKLDCNKHSVTHSNTASHLTSSVWLSTELAVVPRESGVSYNRETFAWGESNYMKLQKCIGILIYKWLCTVQSIPKLGKGYRDGRYKVVILYHK